MGEGWHVGLRGGAEASVAAPVMGWADCAAAGLGDWPQAGLLLGDHDADRAAAFARLAGAFGGGFRHAGLGECEDDFDELPFIDGATAEFKVDLDMGCDRSGVGEGFDHRWGCVDRAFEFFVVREVAEGLDTTCGCASSDRDQFFALGAKLGNAVFVFFGRDRAFDDRQVVGAGLEVAGGFGEVSEVDPICDGEKFVFAIEQSQLAAIAGGEFDDCDRRFFRRRCSMGNTVYDRSRLHARDP